jgi:hypothetical protein
MRWVCVYALLDDAFGQRRLILHCACDLHVVQALQKRTLLFQLPLMTATL